MVLIFRPSDIILKEVSLDRLSFDSASKESSVYDEIIGITICSFKMDMRIFIQILLPWVRRGDGSFPLYRG
jgi:hypothetical protein